MSGVVLMSNINNSSLYIGYSEESVMCVCIMYRSIDQGKVSYRCSVELQKALYTHCLSYGAVCQTEGGRERGG